MRSLFRQDDVVLLFADGTSGVSTVTIAAASGAVLATETATFYGDATTITATAVKSVSLVEHLRWPDMQLWLS